MSITDDKHVCNLCGDHLTSCGLCRGNSAQRVIECKTPPIYDQELADQERSIRRAADIRSGWLKPIQTKSPT